MPSIGKGNNLFSLFYGEKVYNDLIKKTFYEYKNFVNIMLSHNNHSEIQMKSLNGSIYGGWYNY